MYVVIDKSILGKLFLAIYLFDLCFLRWTLIGQGIIKIILLILGIVMIYVYQNARIKVDSIFVILCVIAVYAFFNIIFSGEYEDLFTNLNQIIISMVVAYCFSLMSFEIEKYISTKLIWILNIYFIFNSIIMLIQNQNHDFMMRSNLNAKYFDNLTGLIGECGTHRLTFFWIMLFYLDIYLLNNGVKKCKCLFRIYMIISVLLMFFLSTLNDNRAFYIMFLIAFFGYLLIVVNKKNTMSGFVKILAIGAVLLLSFYITYYGVPSVRYFVNNTLRYKAIQYFDYVVHGKISEISEERLVLLYYTFTDANGWKFGNGIGANMLNRGGVFLLSQGVRDDLCFFTYIGGLVFWLMVSIYYFLTYRIMNKTYYEKNKMAELFLMFFLFVSTVYTNPYTEFLISGSISLTMCMFMQMIKIQSRNKIIEEAIQ